MLGRADVGCTFTAVRAVIDLMWWGDRRGAV